MIDGKFDRLARRVAAMSSRRDVVGKSVAVVAGVLAASGLIGVEGEIKAKNKNKKKRKNKGPQGLACDTTPKLCSSSDECCGGRVCGQNGCAQPDRPRCCGGVGQVCRQSCECCGIDLDCVDRKCVYAPG